ncbi:MAG TPA: PKD domain-containing protein [Bacteroidales bacterium]|nr:PKD domain-containing protein [Bacteroidales bacterium]HOU97989.1 PKD domain-containing protein [Bacteroidales bacterium]
MRRNILFFSLAATIFFLTFIFHSCEKDPVKGWTFYKQSPPPLQITKLTSVVKNCVPPYPVTFYQETINLLGTVTYTWDFGDGSTSHEQNPTHIYPTPGTYKVKLIVTNEISSDTAEISMPELEQASIPVTAGFSYQHYNNNNFAPNKVIFSNSSSGANIFAWDFGDGSQSNDDDPYHIFQNPGTYTVKLRGTCTDGSYNEVTQQIFVSPKPQRVFIDSINLMLPKSYRNTSLFIDMYHNNTYIGRTVVKSPSSFPFKFKRPNDFVDGYFFDNVQFTNNEVFKFLISKSNGSDPPSLIYELDLASIDIQNRFYPRVYYGLEHIPHIDDVFIDLYINY